jgi:hypothetical protein
LLRHNYVPLTIAAAIFYRAFVVEGDRRPETESELETHLDEAARTISIAIPIFRLDLADPVRISHATLAEGTFSGGGRVLRFSDGRPPIEPLGMNKADMETALSKLSHIVPENRPESIVPSRFQRPKI